MNGLTMMILAVVVLGGAYLIYGRYLAKKWGVDPEAKTPAYELEDGVDYVPADTNVVFGHQFASIAGAGPINGPIQAAMFGWLPVMLWILLGGTGFFRNVCFCEEQRPFHRLYYRALHRNSWKTTVFVVYMVVLNSGCCCICRYCSRNL